MNDTHGPSDLASATGLLTSSRTKRKFDDNNQEHFYSFDIDHDHANKSFCCRSPMVNSLHENETGVNGLANYQQTTKIVQEFNIQQSAASDITVSSTINIKSTAKQPSTIKLNSTDLLSEADFERVVQDITPADRDLFDEFLGGTKQKMDDFLLLSSFDNIPNEQDTFLRRHSSFSLPSAVPAISSSDRRRNSMPRGSSTIHYSPHALPVAHRQPAPPLTAAAQTLKQMAVQHQQRILYNHQSTTSSYSSNSSYTPTRQHYQATTSTSSDSDPHFYYHQMRYAPVQQQQQPTTTMSAAYNQRYNPSSIQNYSYQSSFYQQQQQQHQPPLPSSLSSSYPITNYSPSNGTTTSSPPFYPLCTQEENLPILDL